nr:ATP-binding protein [Desulfomonile tiedjei]
MSLHILDVAENGVSAGANLIQITVDEETDRDMLTITIKDNGKGMEPEFLKKVLDPFVTTRTTRKVGLGLSLFQQACQEAEGKLRVESVKGQGTCVSATMKHSHIDRKPLGDVPESIINLVQGNPEVDFVYTHRKNGREFTFDTREIRADLEELSLSNPAVIHLIEDTLRSSLEEIASSTTAAKGTE